MSEINLVAKRGDDEEFAIVLLERDGDPFDLTDCEVVFTAKRLLTDPDSQAVLRKEIGDGITVTDAAAGEATLLIEAADTADLEIDSRGLVLFYDVQVTDADGLVSTPLEGRLMVRPDVTLS